MYQKWLLNQKQGNPDMLHITRGLFGEHGRFRRRKAMAFWRDQQENLRLTTSRKKKQFEVIFSCLVPSYLFQVGLHNSAFVCGHLVCCSYHSRQIKKER
jgi:hypothetical protein